jgi:SEC-C motif-containing protein
MPPDSSLTQAQQRILALMSAGSTASAAARYAGVHRNTVGNWLHLPAFREALAAARQHQDAACREKAASLADQAITAIQAFLADPQVPAAVRLQAALAIRGQPAKPAGPDPSAPTGRNRPCPCGSGRKFKRCCISKH